MSKQDGKFGRTFFSIEVIDFAGTSICWVVNFNYTVLCVIVSVFGIEYIKRIFQLPKLL